MLCFTLGSRVRGNDVVVAGCHRGFNRRTLSVACPIPSACIPCEIRFALSRPLRFAKGRISPPLPPLAAFSTPSLARECSEVVCGGVLLGMVESVVLNRTGCM